MTLESWRNEPCWYASVVDGPRWAVILGPFPTEASCREWAYRSPEDGGNPSKHNRMRAEAEKDPRAVFYGFGMVKLETGHKEGVLNKRLPEHEEDVRNSLPNQLAA